MVSGTVTCRSVPAAFWRKEGQVPQARVAGTWGAIPGGGRGICISLQNGKSKLMICLWSWYQDQKMRSHLRGKGKLARRCQRLRGTSEMSLHVNGALTLPCAMLPAPPPTLEIRRADWEVPFYRAGNWSQPSSHGWRYQSSRLRLGFKPHPYHLGALCVVGQCTDFLWAPSLLKHHYCEPGGRLNPESEGEVCED